MKNKFQNAKIVVGENSKEIQEILFGLGYKWAESPSQYVKHLESPFLIIENGIITYRINNIDFYSSELPLITLDTLKQWVEEDNKVKLVEKEFYYYETTNNGSCIFQLCDLKNEQLFDYYSYFNVSGYVYTFNINGLVKLNKCTLLRPATQEEIKLIKDKVKEQTGNIFNEQTKMFEEPKKEVEFKPFDKVLARDDNPNSEWFATTFSHYCKHNTDYPYCVSRGWFRFCIPYEGNEHLLGTTNNPE